MCELEHDVAKIRSEIHRDCGFERLLPRRRLQCCNKPAAIAKKCCVSTNCNCIRPLSPLSGPLCKAQRTSGSHPYCRNVHYVALVTTDFYVVVYATRNQNAGVCNVKAQWFGDRKLARCTANAAKNLRALTLLLILWSDFCVCSWVNRSWAARLFSTRHRVDNWGDKECFVFTLSNKIKDLC